ncbi:unnamed protein product, partial [Mesorhabditis spiculigera]
MDDRSGSSSSSLFTSGSDSSSTYPPSDLPEFIREDDVLPATPYINADPPPFGHEPACRPVALRGLSEDGKKPAIRNMIDFTQILPVKPPFTAPEPEFVEDITDQQQYTGAERQRYLKLHAKNLKRLEYEKTARVSLPMEALRLYFNPRKYIMMAPRKSDELKWQGVLEGQPDTPYEGGYFWFQVQFSGLYLREAPQITFLTRVWHPYVSAKGSLLLPKEQLDKYPETAIDGLLDWMVELLLTIPPDPPGPYSSITTQFPAEREDPSDDDPEAIARDRARMAREWTKKFALGG